MGIREIYDIGIIGGGTAGLTAAIYGARAGRSVVLAEEKVYGGSIISTDKIENYPGIESLSGAEFAEGLYSQAKKMEIDFRSCRVTGIGIKDDRLKEIQYEGGSIFARTVIIAVGTRPRKLGLANEEYFIGKGMSYCATCDGAFFRGKTVAVIGGGNSALGETAFLSRIAKKVILINRKDSFSGEETVMRTVNGLSNVEILLKTQVVMLSGDGRVESMVIENTDSGERKEISVNGVFPAIGYEPNNMNFDNVVELDHGGYIITDEKRQTKTPGIFAAGDAIRKNYRQLTTAAADGTIAALSASKYLEME
ncbi:MAG: FAD-dependent oxidoreductase [Eubacteriaceae bacterium]|nr:FAD-dependent oxidoreductase [Eubacteriaceae bacterium]